MINMNFMPPELQNKGPLAGLPYFRSPNQDPIYQTPRPFTPLPTPVPGVNADLVGQSMPQPSGPQNANDPMTQQQSPYGGGFFGQGSPFFAGGGFGGGFGGFNPFAALFGGGGFNPFFGGFGQPQVSGMFNNFSGGFNPFGSRPSGSPVQPTQTSYNPYGMLSQGFARYR
jgi:hypothetical protein